MLQRAGITFDHGISGIALYSMPTPFATAFSNERQFEKWLYKYGIMLMEENQVLSADVQHEMRIALRRGDLIGVIPCVPTETHANRISKFLDLASDRGFRALKYRKLSEAIEVIIANNVCAPVPDSERHAPPREDYVWGASAVLNIPDIPDMPDLDNVWPHDVAISGNAMCIPGRGLQDLLRRALAHTLPEDICFVHYPPGEVDAGLLQVRGIEMDLVGVIYTLNQQTLRCIQEKCAVPPISSLPAIVWKLNVVPCVPRDIFSVAVQSARGHTRQDSVIELYVTAQAGATVGMTMVHFFAEAEANAFVRRLRR